MMVGVRMRAVMRVHMFVILPGLKLVGCRVGFEGPRDVLLGGENLGGSVGLSTSAVRNSARSSHLGPLCGTLLV